MRIKNQKGFTLLELLIVIGIIAILAAIILVAVDPARRFAEARNSQRWSAVNGLLSAYLTYVVDNRGIHPITTDTNGNPIVTGIPYEIGTSTADGSASCTATSTTGMDHVDLSILVDEYIASIPIDSVTGFVSSTDFYYLRSSNGRITIGSCAPERSEVIRVQR